MTAIDCQEQQVSLHGLHSRASPPFPSGSFENPCWPLLIQCFHAQASRMCSETITGGQACYWATSVGLGLLKSMLAPLGTKEASPCMLYYAWIWCRNVGELMGHLPWFLPEPRQAYMFRSDPFFCIFSYAFYLMICIQSDASDASSPCILHLSHLCISLSWGSAAAGRLPSAIRTVCEGGSRPFAESSCDGCDGDGLWRRGTHQRICSCICMVRSRGTAIAMTPKKSPAPLQTTSTPGVTCHWMVRIATCQTLQSVLMISNLAEDAAWTMAQRCHWLLYAGPNCEMKGIWEGSGTCHRVDNSFRMNLLCWLSMSLKSS